MGKFFQIPRTLWVKLSILASGFLFSLLPPPTIASENNLPPPQHEIAAVFLSCPARPGTCHPEAKSKNLLGIKPHPP